ncbi:MAG: 2OG-Fe(II) oxygenase [Ilumatobacteraceae bacterium]|nr:2OG-Fe(II) oxygenase [Ilumatobacteraceae bacterium]
METVPTIDLSSSSAGTDLVGALEHAQSALLVGHGIDLDLRRRVIAAARGFFALSREEKAEVQWSGDGLWAGYQPVFEGGQEYSTERAPDLVERFELSGDPAHFLAWPANPPEFVTAWTDYYRACAGLATRLMTLAAEVLDLPDEDLAAWTDQQFANLVANHYLPQPVEPLPGQTRVGSHTDRGGITLLAADEAPGGLEVYLGEQKWTPVVIPPDAYVVQVGDLFARWTNRRIKANVHRVVNPPRSVAASASRLALVYFHYPRLDAIIAPAPSCIGAEGPRYEPVAAGAHTMNRQEAYRKRGDNDYALVGS